MRDIKELTQADLGRQLEDWGLPSFHAEQIFFWIYKKKAVDFESMSNLSCDLRKTLKENFFLYGLKFKEILGSGDSTKKILLELKGKDFIEAVIIPVEGRVTGCISTQAGCKFGCSFCASGILGFKRNLTAGEIIEEILYLKHYSLDNRLTHLVFMGTGEPLDNYDNVLKAIRIVNSKEALAIGARKITISTCGIIPGIKRLQDENLQIELSVSLHAADDKTRSAILPVNRKYPLKELLLALREYVRKTNRQVTFEYVLIKDLNSDLQSAKNLGKILEGLNCKVNLIPCNPIKELKVLPPAKAEIFLFRDCLQGEGINVTLRRPRGIDIEAACGQLRLRYEEK